MGRSFAWWTGTAAVGALGLAFLVLSEPAWAQKTKGKTRLAETKYLMRGISQPNCAALAKMLKEGPADDQAWQQATQYAALLNELGYALMDDGRCPDKEWAGAAKTLRECSAKILDATKDKDAAGARTAFQQLTTACASCHKAHKKS